MIRIGILGCGRIGQVHALSIKQIPSAKLVAVADVNESAAAVCADRFGVDARDASDILEGKDIDAVVIATPSSTHFDLVHAAVVGRKAIFCEKPIDLSSARVRACMDAVENVGVPFMTAFNQRFDPHFGELARRVHEGEIGNVETITITSRDPAPPPLSYLKTSGGLFRDMMIHDFDLARFLMREDPVRVFATGSVLVEPSIAEVGDVDTAAVILTTTSGRICQISNSRRSTYGYDQRLEVHGSRGMLRVKNVHESRVEQATEAGFAMPVAQPFFLERFGAAYLAEMRYFVDAVSAGKMPKPDASDGLKAQLIADAATLSWQRGQPVDIAG
ncbi:inositol 2-dehydrogenase [Burkholderia sp. Ac-20344]|uniref:inositol 2-dehydrogenase n=1 Tax=Burkholderia sp. Ac-20344 TaxID=2703890 RepID=UPI00197BE442|nr:inositol 2-dehydrogenase [Burkholderia sp. Ac-20344]MBN3836003.1 inositol 2-dehydrogenase [Burkholderia sp. Ac-20344]